VRVTASSPRHDIDAVVYRSALVEVGRWRCPPDHPHFVDSGPASQHLFVFPRDGVWIQHEGRRPFLADPNIVTFYNRGQRYQRQPLNGAADRCEYYAVEPGALAGTLTGVDPSAADRPDRPFPFTHGPSDQHSYLRQRRVFEHVTREARPDRLFVEESVLEVLVEVARAAYERAGRAGAAATAGRRDADVSEAARQVIARRFTDNLSLADIGREVGASVFHLARVFRRHTGFSMHAYRTQLRLRTALEQIADPQSDLLEVALSLGFSSHSHFTEAFRKNYGVTPSAARASFSLLTSPFSLLTSEP